MPAHVGAGVPVNRDTHRGLSPRGYDSHWGECYVDEPLALITPTAKYYYHANHLYSVAALTNNVGVVVERYRYDAYGQRTVLAADGITTRTASNYGNQIGFTGRYLDSETELYYFRARYYSGTLGRFIGRDTRTYVVVAGLYVPTSGMGYQDGMNLYMGYMVPNYTDPSGLGFWTCCDECDPVGKRKDFKIDDIDITPWGTPNPPSEVRDNADALLDSINTAGGLMGVGGIASGGAAGGLGGAATSAGGAAAGSVSTGNENFGTNDATGGMVGDILKLAEAKPGQAFKVWVHVNWTECQPFTCILLMTYNDWDDGAGLWHMHDPGAGEPLTPASLAAALAAAIPAAIAAAGGP